MRLLEDIKVDRTYQLIIGELYHITWGWVFWPANESESLIQKTDNDLFPVSWIASLGEPTWVDSASVGLNWGLIEKIVLVSKKDLPLYVSWKTGKFFERLLKNEGR